MPDIKRTADEIEALRDKLDTSGKTRFAGMKFEQGAAEVIDWLFGDDEAMGDFTGDGDA